MPNTCRHCSRAYKCRTGRGLCRQCWERPSIRERYPIVAAFGSQAASAIAAEGHKRRLAAKRAAEEQAAVEAVVAEDAARRFGVGETCDECHGLGKVWENGGPYESCWVPCPKCKTLAVG
jgi:hypothetical protein